MTCLSQVPFSAIKIDDARPEPRYGRRRAPEWGCARFNEEVIIRRMLRSLHLPKDGAILDVGCGFGRKMEWLKCTGCRVDGVDVNEDALEYVQSQGFNGMTPEEFSSTQTQYDAMLMAHIIEHFGPADLLEFADKYLDRLKVGGHLIISTPLNWNNFYNDFDHVKPYCPQAFVSVFSNRLSQVQYHARNQLKLVDVGLRRVPKCHPGYEKLYAAFYKTDVLWKCARDGMDRVWKIVFVLSGGAWGGVTNGWVGLFQKVG